MAQVSILRRSRSLSPAAVGPATEVVEVTYSTPAVPPRDVHLPLEWYRPATGEELNANPRYQMALRDGTSELAERLAIEQDMKAYFTARPQTFESP